MRGHLINNPRLEFLAPVFERWVECIDRYNRCAGDAEAPYWHGATANAGLLAAAAWQAELTALQQFSGKKQRDDEDREARCDLWISSLDEALYLSVSQRWPKMAGLDMAAALQQTAALAHQVAYPSQLKAGALFISPCKAGQHASPEELQDLVDDLQKHTACAIAWYFPYAYRKLHDALGNYYPGVALLLRQS
ncbi:MULTISPECIES: hypothetical protein [Pseudomonas]|uniref:hypothetical protein n=1 Tax=Pseudomonas TaxID=286 RepID=UPI000411B07C|nr:MULTISPECIES: hypothetical protein [Pseudomonas]MBK4988382.1 hypothetical protein [Pseudomonas sp. S36]